MGTAQAEIFYKLNDSDFEKVLDKKLSTILQTSFLNKFDNVLVGTKDIAKFHSVNERTILNYIKDGLIVPEVKLGEKDHHQFRLSYALTLDFKELQKQLRAKNKGWNNK